jgi:hypothetical protein
MSESQASHTSTPHGTFNLPPPSSSDIIYSSPYPPTQQNNFKSAINIDIATYDIPSGMAKKPYVSPYSIPPENIANNKRGKDQGGPIHFKAPSQYSKERFSPMRLPNNDTRIFVPRKSALKSVHRPSKVDDDTESEILDETSGMDKVSSIPRFRVNPQQRLSTQDLEESEDDMYVPIMAQMTASKLGRPRRNKYLNAQSDSEDEIIGRKKLGSQGTRGQKKRSGGQAKKIEELVERKVAEVLAGRARDQSVSAASIDTSEALQRRLKALERKIESVEAENASLRGSADPVKAQPAKKASKPLRVSAMVAAAKMRDMGDEEDEGEVERRRPERKGSKRRKVSE